MTHDDRDQKGGHPRRDKPRSGLRDCLCCEVRVPDCRSTYRAVRERDARRYERAAEGDLFAAVHPEQEEDRAHD